MKFRILIVSLLVITLILSSCNSSENKPITTPAEQLGANETKLSLLAPSGYAENGDNDSSVNIVDQFQKESKCEVTINIEDNSEKRVEKFKTRQYDGVVGDARVSGELMNLHELAPINTGLVSPYADVIDQLKMQSWNSKDGVSYGIPISIGTYSYAYNSDVIKTQPTSLSDLYSGKKTSISLSMPDNPIMIAQAGLYVKSHDAKSSIKNPFALDQTQMKQVKIALKNQQNLVKTLYQNDLEAQHSFSNGANTGIFTPPVIAALNAENIATSTIEPKEGTLAFSDTWMMSAYTKHPNCMYAWLNYITSPQVNANFAQYIGFGPANRQACSLTSDKNYCSNLHTNDPQFLNRLTFITLPKSNCLDDREDIKCEDFVQWKLIWDEIMKSKDK